MSLRAVLCAVAVLLALPNAASGATGSVSGGVLTYAGDATADDVRISARASHYEIEERTATPLSAGPGCTTSRDKVHCPYSAGIKSITASLDGGDDKLTNLTLLPLTVEGGIGDDVLTGGIGDDHLVGGPGKDTFAAGGGEDVVDAADGSADSGSCGYSVDTVLFDTHDVFDSSCEGWSAGSPGTGSPDVGAGTGPDGSGDGVPDDDPGTGDDGGNVFEAPIAVSFGAKPSAFDVRRGTVALALSCGEADGCRGRVTLAMTGRAAAKGSVAAARKGKRRRRAKTVTIGAKSFELAAGKRAAVPVKLSRRGRRALGSRRRTKVQATIEMNTAAGKRVETRTIVVERRVTRKPRKPTRRRR